MADKLLLWIDRWYLVGPALKQGWGLKQGRPKSGRRLAVEKARTHLKYLLTVSYFA